MLHDVGHGPFSHAAEDLMPVVPDENRRYAHEEYSASIIRHVLRKEIEQHPLNNNCGITADQVADFVEGKAKPERMVFWRTLLDGQIDADRMDYLLRDSHHAGVRYGSYDLERIVATITLAAGEEGGSPRLGVSEGGAHAAESVVLARHLMFTQVYFHKTRVAYDLLLRRLLAALLPGGVFPPPVPGKLGEYLEWDDWEVLGMVKESRGGEEGDILKNRRHYRSVYATPEVASAGDLEKLVKARAALGDMLISEEKASKSWYKLGAEDIPVVRKGGSAQPLTRVSSVVDKIKPVSQSRLYVRAEDAEKGRAAVQGIANDAA